MTDFSKVDKTIVATLVRKVLINEMSAREAILSFPADSKDPSIITAYHAIVHFEADEDLRKRDEVYRQEQDDYLELISNTLEKGDELPQNFIKGYDDFYKSASLPHENNSKGVFRSFWIFLNIDNSKL